MKTIEITGYPFVAHVNQSARPKRTFNISLPLEDTNIQRSGCFKNLGYLYDLRPHLKKFVVKQYDSWQEYYAPNKTLLRKAIYGRVQTIVEIK